MTTVLSETTQVGELAAQARHALGIPGRWLRCSR
jgi:hypothetical protein